MSGSAVRGVVKTLRMWINDTLRIPPAFIEGEQAHEFILMTRGKSSKRNGLRLHKPLPMSPTTVFPTRSNSVLENVWQCLGHAWWSDIGLGLLVSHECGPGMLLSILQRTGHLHGDRPKNYPVQNVSSAQAAKPTDT